MFLKVYTIYINQANGKKVFGVNKNMDKSVSSFNSAKVSINENLSKFQWQTYPAKKTAAGKFFNKHLEKLLSQIQLYEFTDKKVVEKLIEANPEIEKLLAKFNIKVQINIANLETITDAHLNPTLEIANAILEKLSKQFDFSVEQRKALIKGAIFHDFGKVLIPAEILNKTGKLDEDERKIVELHSELGYQLLKNCNGFSETVLNIIRKHHKFADGSGYPENLALPQLIEQIVTVADIFSALKSKRSYKDVMKDEEALEILKEKVDNGKIKKNIYKALEEYVYEQN